MAKETNFKAVVKEKVDKQGVKCLALYLGYQDYSKEDDKTGEIKYSLGYQFLKYDGKTKDGLFVGAEVLTFWDKSPDHLYLRTVKAFEPIGLSVVIMGGASGLFTQVQNVLDEAQTAALKTLYGV